MRRDTGSNRLEIGVGQESSPSRLGKGGRPYLTSVASFASVRATADADPSKTWDRCGPPGLCFAPQEPWTAAPRNVVILPAVLASYTAAAARARRLFTSPRTVRRLNCGTGIVMAGAAVTVATR